MLLISVPVWGRDYVRIFAEAAAPALLAAAARLGEPVQFIIHTSRAEELVVRAALPGQDVEVRYVPDRPTYEALQEAHAEAVACAVTGTRVVLLNADLVVSGNFLLRCAEHLAAGRLAVVLLGIRTAADPRERPPAGVAPRVLLEWAWAHRHRIIRDLEWPHGTSLLPTNIFWSAGASTVARGFHLHPAAIVRHAGMSFRSTIDGDLLDCFPREAVHVVVDPDDCSMCEISPPERRFPVRGQLTPQGVAASMRARASATHRWLFGEHRIVVRGDGGEVAGDDVVAREVLRMMGEPPRALADGSAAHRERELLRRVPAGRRASVPAGRRS